MINRFYPKCWQIWRELLYWKCTSNKHWPPYLKLLLFYFPPIIQRIHIIICFDWSFSIYRMRFIYGTQNTEMKRTKTSEGKSKWSTIDGLSHRRTELKMLLNRDQGCFEFRPLSASLILCLRSVFSLRYCSLEQKETMRRGRGPLYSSHLWLLSMNVVGDIFHSSRLEDFNQCEQGNPSRGREN